MRAFVVASSPQSLKPASASPHPGDLVIAADGGANLCRAWGWTPTCVVGDMDSLRPATVEWLHAHSVPLQRHPVEKDQTDLELALSAALTAGVDEIIIAGALGARIDHTLGNLALLALPTLAGVQTCIADGGQTIWLVRSRLTIHGQPGDTLSLIPFGGDAAGVEAVGVHWPLHDARLALGPSLGISNRLEDDRAEVAVRQGSLLVVHTRSEAVVQEHGKRERSER